MENIQKIYHCNIIQARHLSGHLMLMQKIVFIQSLKSYSLLEAKLSEMPMLPFRPMQSNSLAFIKNHNHHSES